MDSPQIVCLGGFPQEPMLDYVLGLARGRRVLYVPTAANEDPSSTVEWYQRLRRPVHEALVRDGFPPGLAVDDAGGAHSVGTELREILTTQPGACGYELGPDGEHPLGARRV